MISAHVNNLPADHYWLKLHQDTPGRGYLFELHITHESDDSVAFVENFRATCFRHLGSAPMGMPKPADKKDPCWFLPEIRSDWKERTLHASMRGDSRSRRDRRDPGRG
jgi:hypothetical protein